MIRNFYQILDLPNNANQSEVESAIRKIEDQHKNISDQEWNYLKRIMLRPKARDAYNIAIDKPSYKENFYSPDAMPFTIDPNSAEHIQGIKSEERKRLFLQWRSKFCLFIFFIVSVLLFFI